MRKRKKSRAGREPALRVTLSAKYIQDLLAREKRFVVHDALERDLSLRVETTGSKVFFWWKRVRGQARFKRIGRWPAMPLDKARGEAKKFSGKLEELKSADYNPNVADPYFSGSHRGELDLGKLLDDYIARRLERKSKNPQRAEANARTFFAYVQDWSGRKLSQLSRREVIERHSAIGEDHPVTANRVVQLLRTMYNFADSQELYRGQNPGRNVEMFREESRDRYVQREELPRLFGALQKCDDQDLVDCIKLLLWTGARRGDLLAARWEQISLTDNRWLIPHPKGRKAYAIALAPEAVSIFKDRKRISASPWVFPGRSRTGHIINISKRWVALRKQAGLPDLTLHDLRRTLGSWQANAGVSLPIIGRSLGHRSLRATEIYSRVNVQSVRPSVEKAVTSMVRYSKKR